MADGKDTSVTGIETLSSARTPVRGIGPECALHHAIEVSQFWT